MGTRAHFYVAEAGKIRWIGMVQMEGEIGGAGEAVLGTTSRATFEAAVANLPHLHTEDRDRKKLREAQADADYVYRFKDGKARVYHAARWWSLGEWEQAEHAHADADDDDLIEPQGVGGVPAWGVALLALLGAVAVAVLTAPPPVPQTPPVPPTP